MGHTARPEDDIEAKLDEINKRTGRNMVQAVVTGALLVILVVASLIFNTQIFLWLVIIFVCIALWELRVDFSTIGIRIPLIPLIIMTVGTLAAIYYVPAQQPALTAALGCTITAALSVIFSCFENFKSAKVERSLSQKAPHSKNNIEHIELEHSRLTHIGATLLAVFYITVLGSFIVLPVTRDHPVAFEFMVIFLPSLGDIGGLAFGAAFGKHKLSPRISPKKSVEGLIGSVLFSAIGSFVIGVFAYSHTQFAQHVVELIILGICVGIVGLFGDLCASMLKRDMGLKDMGTLLAGHGGVLDRVDSILMCAPVICILIMALGL
ncbi:phosphatidate cytidylyltransferase [Alloscardovia venturai]|uniref:Phosphatidate cytidylyltransferase n=1 Tax=Alloscardovia venturai TaxID=1769421 RepID=A0ABW2Y3V7_9BIFI